MDTGIAPRDTADSIVDDVDNYDWNECVSGSTREDIPEVSQPKEASPKTPTGMSLILISSNKTVPTEARSLIKSTGRRFRRTLLIPESFDEIGLRLSNEFPPVIEKDADTLIYSGVPPPTPNQDPHEVDYTERLFKPPYLMKSTTLQATKSSKFEKFLGPMSARTARKLKKIDLHKSLPVQLLDNIKFYVDLSPILNDEEALIQITDLTVPHSALKWHQVAKKLGIPASHVGGRDELNVPPKRVYTLIVSEKPSDEELNANESKSLDDPTDKASKLTRKKGRQQSPPAPQMVELPLQEEYTALRHHTATARMLQALAGNDPKLNSAAKAWTFCMLAKYFDCAHSPAISHWIVSWLLENGNSHFIQNNPEVAYRMALATRSVWLIRCTFAIMVGQRAMTEGTTDLLSSNGEEPKKYQAHHAASCLDDDEIDRIDHAATALARRARETLEEVAAFPGIWNVEASPKQEMAKLKRLSFDDSEYQALLETIKDQVKAYVRRMIYMTLSASYDLESVKSLGPFKGFGRFSTYTDIPQPLRLLTQHFWHILRLEQFARDYTDTPENHQIWAQTQAKLKELGMITGSDIPYVSRKTLFASFDKLNHYLVSKFKHGLLKSQSIPGRTVTPESSSSAKKIKLSPDTKQHSRSFSGDLEPLVQILDSSSVCPVFPETTPEHIADSSKGKVILSDDQDDWQDTVEDLHTLGRSPLKTLPIRQKPSAIAAQVTSSSSRPVPFGTDMKMYDHTVSDSVDSALHNRPSPGTSEDGVSPTRVPLDARILQPHESAAFADFEERTTPKAVGWSSRFFRRRTSSMALANDNDEKREMHSTGQNQVSFDPFIHVAPPPRSPSPFQSKPMQPRNLTSAPINPGPTLIAPAVMLDEISRNLYKRLSSIITPGYVLDGTCDFDIPNGEISTLLCLNDNEWKYLPLWAGGLDDGTGGVFNDGIEVPDAPDVEDGGFRGGAMGIIPGVGSSIGRSMDGSDFEEIMTEVGISTVGRASRNATDGTATETVISLDE